MYYQAGDIVSLVDEESNVYYAQIRGFLQDQYYEKSAVITWLLPTKASDRSLFDPSTYILGKFVTVFNPFPKDKNLDSSEHKEFADNSS